MNKRNLNAVHDKDLNQLLKNLGLMEKMNEGKLKCKFTGTPIDFENLYSIFPESGDIKVVCDSPEAIKLFTDYVNEHKL
ncbi:MAG: hypothetical protein KGZ81_08715 [Flavobacteriales bacterium]|nr:hypothetical protein [Flavobacteriales bacterium]